MSMVGKLTFFLGFQIHESEIEIFLSHEKYAWNLIKKFELEQAIAKGTSTLTHVNFSKDNVGKKLNESLYCSIIWSLLYLTASCPDTSYTVEVCARYQADSRESHLDVLNVF